MNSIWHNLYDRAKDRRYGGLFFFAFVLSLGFVFGVIALRNGIENFNLQNPYADVLIGIFVLVVVLSIRGWLRASSPQMRQSHFPPLSRDERNKARSKLKIGFRPPPVNLPDTDLKH